ncbi:C-type mannose receptor 2-like [Diprion similis]|uniref:C-type mannose receptor 2-like n=1 Tax=Diprion similis TaxID=362088 RepID=UPI001EF91FFC|nr:C-type mannose receptor 2-like [Diprion similis]
MSSGFLVTLPLQLACQMINGGNPNFENISFVFNKTTPLPEGYTDFPDVGFAYKYYATKMTWNTARKQCITEGGSLAVIDSLDKVKHISSLKEKSVNVHVGLHRLFNAAVWTSVRSGQPVGFVPWKPEANAKAGVGNCAVLWSDGSGVSPSKCNEEKPSVCEIPLSKKYQRKVATLQNVESLRQSKVSVDTRRVV